MSATPRTDAARACCGFADMAKMELELAEALKERDLARERGFEMADVLEKAERERDEARFVAEKALSDNVLGHHTQELLRKELAEAREKIATLATAAKNIALAYDPRYFRAGKWAVEAFEKCGLSELRVDWGTPESWREPETFEAHGHTWTRHTPGDPCPVPPAAEIQAMREAIKEAYAALEDWQLFWKENAGNMSSMSWTDGRALGEPTAVILAKLQPFIKP